MADEKEKPCPFGCNGTGVVLIDDLNVRECLCAYARRLKVHLGPEIANAPNLEGESPLFWPPDEVDLTEKNIVIQGYWTDILPHLRWAIGCKGPLFRFKIITDEKMKTVFVGAESYQHRARSERDNIETNNSLNDIVGPEWDLLIIRLGFLGYKNQAMPGALKEALMLREVALKPTWIIEAPQAPYAPGHNAFSEETFDYIQRRFEMIPISEYDANRKEAVAPQNYKKKGPRPIVARETPAGMDVEETESAAAEVETSTDTEVEPPPSQFGMDLDMPGAGKSKKTPWNKKGRKGHWEH